MHPIERIIENIPLSFFIDVMDGTNGAWAKAHKETQERYEAPERQNMLGQNRHAHSESAFREAAKTSGLSCTTRHTEPAGGRYSLVKSNDVYFIRSNIQAHCGIPKPTVFRRTWASLNEWLDPIQLNFLSKVKIPDSSKLCAMIVSTYSPKGQDQTVPAFMGVGIPKKDFSGWKMLKSFEEIITLYHDRDVTVRKVYEKPLEIKDIAIPRLKKRD